MKTFIFMSYIGIHDAQFSIIITIFHCLYDVKDREQKIKNSYFHILLYEFNLEKKNLINKCSKTHL